MPLHRRDEFAKYGWTDADSAAMDSRPDSIRIIVSWGEHRRDVEVDVNAFFGRGGGSPLSGEALIAMLGNLVRQGCPPKP